MKKYAIAFSVLLPLACLCQAQQEGFMMGPASGITPGSIGAASIQELAAVQGGAATTGALASVAASVPTAAVQIGAATIGAVAALSDLIDTGTVASISDGSNILTGAIVFGSGLTISNGMCWVTSGGSGDSVWSLDSNNYAAYGGGVIASNTKGSFATWSFDSTFVNVGDDTPRLIIDGRPGGQGALMYFLGSSSAGILIGCDAITNDHKYVYQSLSPDAMSYSVMQDNFGWQTPNIISMSVFAPSSALVINADSLSTVLPIILNNCPTTDPGTNGMVWCDTSAGNVLKMSLGN